MVTGYLSVESSGKLRFVSVAQVLFVFQFISLGSFHGSWKAVESHGRLRASISLARVVRHRPTGKSESNEIESCGISDRQSVYYYIQTRIF